LRRLGIIVGSHGEIVVQIRFQFVVGLCIVMGHDAAMVELLRLFLDLGSGIFIQVLIVGALVGLELFAVPDDSI
jgi:hypothetical protein